MGVHAEVDGTIHAVRPPPVAYGGSHRRDMVFVEGAAQRRPPVAGGPEHDALRRLAGIGAIPVVGELELREVHEVLRG